MIDVQELHAPLWEKMQPLLLKNRIPQALLFVGPRHANILQFTHRLIALLICEANHAPCGVCRACHLLIEGIHPDISYISQDAPGSAIKIEQIREIQQDIYQTPQRASRRFIVIDPADKLNVSAANALLKILEEPPSHTLFILIAEQLGSMLPTILSRCQKVLFSSQSQSSSDSQGNYLTIGQLYSKDAPRAVLVKDAHLIITALCELVEGKVSPCTIAAQWSVYVFEDLLWLLHLITAQAIHFKLMENHTSVLDTALLTQFPRLRSPVNLFGCLDQINAITKKIHHNINMNQTLVLEDLLLRY